MKTALFAGVAAMLLIASVPGVAAVGDAAPASAPAPARDLTFAQLKAVADQVWDRLDSNRDGRIDSADRDGHVLERFAKMDTNHDGVISKEEFLAAAHAHEAKRHGHHPDGHDGAPPPPPGAAGHDREDRRHGGPGMQPGGFAAMMIIHHALHDARKDGVVTRAAFDAALKARFDKLDVNHDGTVTREELRAAMSEHRRGGEGPHGWHHEMPPPPAGGQ